MKSGLILSAALVLGLFASCSDSRAPKAVAETVPCASSIIESSSYVGLWQKFQEITVEDAETEMVIKSVAPTNLFKCILPDGNYFLYRAFTDATSDQVVSRVEVYGTYKMQGDSVVVEHIVTNCALPELSNIDSDVIYKMSDKDNMDVYYKLRNSDGTPGSSEYLPEHWQRVPAATPKQ